MMKRQEQSEMEATLAVVLLCARFYMHGPIHKNPKKNGIHLWGGEGSILQRRKKH